jgi:hypothetical protein
MIAVGTPITGRPPHNAVRAAFPHQMWRATFEAECGVGIYVVPGSFGPFRHRKLNFERHITNRSTPVGSDIDAEIVLGDKCQGSSHCLKINLEGAAVTGAGNGLPAQAAID